MIKILKLYPKKKSILRCSFQYLLTYYSCAVVSVSVAVLVPVDVVLVVVVVVVVLTTSGAGVGAGVGGGVLSLIHI